MSTEFNGKVALVTGAGSGIGRACAIAFARDGARVVVSDVDEAGGAETVKAIEDAGGTAIFVRCDVSQSADVRSMIERTIAEYGRLDYACNNAGIGGHSAATADYTEEGWSTVISVNLTGVFLCMKYEIPELLKAGGGAIVNVASILGVVGFANAPAYVAAKHGVLGLTKTTAMEYATQGIRVNAVCPAFIDTPMLARAGLTTNPEVLEMIRSLHPIGRLGTSEEVAEAVVWLCSDRSSFVTGHPMLVDGAYVAR